MEAEKPKEKSLLTQLAEAHGVDKVRLWHGAGPKRRKEDKKGPSTGRTFAVFWKGNKRYVGIANVNPQSPDQYTKHMARTIAINKAIHAMKCDTDPKFQCRRMEVKDGIQTEKPSRAEKLAQRPWRDKPNILVLDMTSAFTAGTWKDLGAPNFLMSDG